jgi:hypothetical protein
MVRFVVLLLLILILIDGETPFFVNGRANSANDDLHGRNTCSSGNFCRDINKRRSLIGYDFVRLLILRTCKARGRRRFRQIVASNRAPHGNPSPKIDRYDRRLPLDRIRALGNLLCLLGPMLT